MWNVPPRGTPAEFFVDGREKATHEKATAHGPWDFSTVAVAPPSASAVDMSTTCTVQRARAAWSGSGRRDSRWKVHAAQRSSESNSESTRLPTSPEAPKMMTGPAGARPEPGPIAAGPGAVGWRRARGAAPSPDHGNCKSARPAGGRGSREFGLVLSRRDAPPQTPEKFTMATTWMLHNTPPPPIDVSGLHAPAKPIGSPDGTSPRERRDLRLPGAAAVAGEDAPRRRALGELRRRGGGVAARRAAGRVARLMRYLMTQQRTKGAKSQPLTAEALQAAELINELVDESRKAGASPGGRTILSRASTDHSDGAPPGTALSAVQVQQLWLARLLRDDALSVSSYCEEEANESPRSRRRSLPPALLSRVLKLQRLAPLSRTPSLLAARRRRRRTRRRWRASWRRAPPSMERRRSRRPPRRRRRPRRRPTRRRRRRRRCRRRRGASGPGHLGGSPRRRALNSPGGATLAR